jgi:hypothetical protein
MKRIAFALFALTLGCGAAEGADNDSAGLTFDCAHVRVPPMSAVSAVTGIDNFSHAYAAREMYLHQAQRLCRNPAVAVVHFVPESTVTVRTLDSVAAR